jgi:hypothetical protein
MKVKGKHKAQNKQNAEYSESCAPLPLLEQGAAITQTEAGKKNKE